MAAFSGAQVNEFIACHNYQPDGIIERTIGAQFGRRMMAENKLRLDRAVRGYALPNQGGERGNVTTYSQVV